MTLDQITEANWYLDTDIDPHHEESPKRSAQKIGLKHTIKYATTPTFSHLNKRFWFDRFSGMKYHELQAEAKAIGHKYIGVKAEVLISELTKYWMSHINIVSDPLA